MALIQHKVSAILKASAGDPSLTRRWGGGGGGGGGGEQAVWVIEWCGMERLYG